MSVLTWSAAASLAAWLWLLLARGRFWRTDTVWPKPAAEPEHWPAVAVVVPARDEAGVLPQSLPSLLAQEYPGPVEVFLVDDGSADGTGELARALGRAASAGGGLPLTVDSPGEPPAGWTGKLWAVRHGIRLARARGNPEFLLLTDADIAHPPDSLRRLVAAALGSRLDLVSQLARLRTAGGWECLVVPAFVYFFAQLYPFRWVNRPGARTAAAAGGCVLLRTEAAVRAGVPERIRDAVIDDVALARAVKHGGGRGTGRIWLGFSGGAASVRPYQGLGELWRMVARSAYAQLRHSPLLLAGTVAAMVLVYLVPPVAALAGARTAVWAGTAAWAAMAATYAPVLRAYGRPVWPAAALPAAAALFLAMTVDSARLHLRGRGAAWKGRTYP